VSIITIFHGSEKEIKNPNKNKGKIYNDYGQGFYCTKHKNLAAQWACRYGEDGIISEYEIDTEDLDILVLDENYHILNWLSILSKNREFSDVTVISNAEYVIENYMIDYEKYDIIIGYRADDAYYRFVREFLSGLVGIQTLEDSMYLGEQGLQVFIQSERAFSYLRFIKSYEVDQEEYFLINKGSIDKANSQYEELKKDNESKDIYIRDIKGGVLNEDSIPKIKIK